MRITAWKLCDGLKDLLVVLSWYEMFQITLTNNLADLYSGKKLIFNHGAARSSVYYHEDSYLFV